MPIGEPSVSPSRTPPVNVDAVGLDLHASAAPVAALAPREIGVHVLGEERQTRGDPLDDGGDARSVRLARRHPAKLRHA